MPNTFTAVPSPLVCYLNGATPGAAVGELAPPMNASGSGRDRTTVPRLWWMLGDAPMVGLVPCPTFTDALRTIRTTSEGRCVEGDEPMRGSIPIGLLMMLVPLLLVLPTLVHAASILRTVGGVL